MINLFVIFRDYIDDDKLLLDKNGIKRWKLRFLVRC